MEIELLNFTTLIEPLRSNLLNLFPPGTIITSKNISHFYKKAESEIISSFKRLEIIGLMSIPPFLDAEELRPYHRKLRELKDMIMRKVNPDPNVFRHLSMGMSADFDVAIEEGATMIRIGSILFGARNYS